MTAPTEPRAWHQINLIRGKGKASELRFTSARVFFWDLVPIAVHSGGVLHFTCMPGQQQRYINALADRLPEVALVRCDPLQFDFILGSTLTQAGLPLTRSTNAAQADAART